MQLKGKNKFDLYQLYWIRTTCLRAGSAWACCCPSWSGRRCPTTATRRPGTPSPQSSLWSSRSSRASPTGQRRSWSPGDMVGDPGLHDPLPPVGEALDDLLGLLCRFCRITGQLIFAVFVFTHGLSTTGTTYTFRGFFGLKLRIFMVVKKLT